MMCCLDKQCNAATYKSENKSAGDIYQPILLNIRHTEDAVGEIGETEVILKIRKIKDTIETKMKLK